MTPTEEIVQITKELITFRTVKDNFTEIRKCTNYIKNYFLNTQVMVKELEYNKVLSLYLTYEEETKHQLLLNGHYDVVEGEDEQFKAKETKEKLYGRGALDMKTGIATIMYIMKHFSEKKPSLAALITSDEEVGGKNGTKPAIASGITADLVIALEQNNNETADNLAIVDGGKGLLQLEITTKGKAAHGAYPWKGENAAEKLMKKYFEIKKMFPEVTEEDPWHNSMNLGNIHAGDIPNKVPDKATAVLDIRYTEKDTPEKIINKIKSVGVEINIIGEGPITYNDPNNKKIKEFIQTCEEITGKTVLRKKIMGASDIRYTAEKNIPSILTGPWGENMHGKKEYIIKQSIIPVFEALEKYINHLS